MHSLKYSLAFLAVSMLEVPTAHAQWAVVDAPAIVQLIQEVQTTAQQLATAKAQLLQAEQALQTMTGHRGMEQIRNGTKLPAVELDSGERGASRHGRILCPVDGRAKRDEHQCGSLAPAVGEPA